MSLRGFGQGRECMWNTGQMNGFLTPSVKHEWSVMVQGCFGAGELGDWYKVQGTRNITILFHNVMPFPVVSTWLVQVSSCDSRKFEAYFRAMQNLSGEETESQSTVFGIACIIARFKPQWGPVGQALKCKVREKCPTSQSHLWEVLQNVWVEIFPEYL